MTTPGILRAQAAQLREAATRMRQQADILDGQVPQVQARYPLPSEGLWSGPNADTCRGALATAAGDVQRTTAEVHGYADSCLRRAAALEQDALDAEQAG